MSKDRLELLRQRLSLSCALCRAIDAAEVRHRIADWNPDSSWLAITEKGYKRISGTAARIPVSDLEGLCQKLESESNDPLIRMAQDALNQVYSLASAVRDAQVLDFSLYGPFPGVGWSAIRRRDYLKIHQQVARFDLWAPWKSVIQNRLPGFGAGR